MFLKPYEALKDRFPEVSFTIGLQKGLSFEDIIPDADFEICADMGKLEESMVLEMVIPEFGNGLDMDLMIIKFTDEYCNKYNQEAVFVTVSEVSGSTLTKGTRPLISKIVKQGGP